MSEPSELLAIGRIGPVHGVRGELFVEPWTDQPEERFAAGSVLATDPPTAGPLTVESVRMHSGKLVVGFAGILDRGAAAALRGVLLVITAGERPPLTDPDEYYVTDLVGLAARTVEGQQLGPIRDVLDLAGTDYLVLDVEGTERLVPFVAAIVTEVDLSARTVLIAPPAGLFGL